MRIPTRSRPFIPRSTLGVALAVVLAAAGCGSSVAPSALATGVPASVPATISATDTPLTSVSPAPSAPSETTPATPEESPAATSSAAPSATAGGPDAAAAACSGSSEVKDFFVAIAQAVPWHVYCAVLPAGWSVEGGTYRLAAGGRMEMSYKTASGGHLQLREGHWCTDGPSACSPGDADLGSGPFGAETGDVKSMSGGFALYVAAGQNPSWTASATGIDEATFRQLCIHLALVRA
jgi:hypothetical protein